MPGNLLSASVGASVVLPNSLYTSLTESLVFPLLVQAAYHDTTVERSLITDTVNTPVALRSWRFSKRLTVAQFDLLYTFWSVTVLGGLRAFHFYPAPAQFDGTGASSTGRITAIFRGSWSQSFNIGLHDIPSIEILEVG